MCVCVCVFIPSALLFLCVSKSSRIRFRKIMHLLALVQPPQLFIALETAATSSLWPLIRTTVAAVYYHDFRRKTFGIGAD